MQTTKSNNWDIFKTISGPSEGLFKDKGSRFIAYAYPISSPDEVKPLVDAIKKEHHAARHHCYSYRLGYDGAVFRANDDGEPSGTAGKPILGIIDSLGLSDVLVVVVRYFGGILLGVPGLIRAYREATADALANAVVIEKTATRRYRLEFDYLQMNLVQQFLKTEGLKASSQEFDLQCAICVDVPLSQEESLLDKINRNNNEKGTCIQCRPLQTSPAGA